MSCDLRLVDVCVSSSVFFFKQKTAYEMLISDWSSDVCSSDLYSLDRACHNAVLAASDPLNPGDLLALELDAMTVRRERRMTAVNQPLLDELTLRDRKSVV